MKITKKWLEEKKACVPKHDIKKAAEIGDAIEIIKILFEEKNNFEHANWLLLNTLDDKSLIKYSDFVHENALNFDKKKYFANGRFRKTFEFARKHLENKIKKKKASAYDIAYSTHTSCALASYIAHLSNKQDTLFEMRKKIIEYGIELIKEGGTK